MAALEDYERHQQTRRTEMQSDLTDTPTRSPGSFGRDTLDGDVADWSHRVTQSIAEGRKGVVSSNTETVRVLMDELDTC